MAFKNLFVKESTDETKVEKTTSKTPTNFQQPSSVNTLATPTQFANNTVTAAEKNEFAEFLNAVYQQGNFPGPDYQEFTDAIKTMDAQPIPENVKFTAIFAGFQVQNVTKARLIETGSKYIDMINQQVAGFNDEIEKTLNTEVAQKQNSATKIAQENEEIEQQMVSLTQKKNRNAEAIQKLNAEVNEQTTSLSVKKSSFKMAADEFIANVQANIQKIKTYLPDALPK